MLRILGAVLAVLCVASFGATLYDEPCDPHSADLVQRGRALFSETCTYCHSENAAGGGGGAPSFLARPELSASDVFETITNGRVRGTTIMPAWKDALSEGERWALTGYILSPARTRP